MDTIAFEQVYYMAETISAFVVIISLFYLGYQLRQNTQTMRATATQAHIEAYQNTIGNFIHVPGLVSIWQRALDDPKGLKDDERVQYVVQMSILLRTYETAFIQWQSGALDERLFIGFQQSFVDVFSNEGAKWFWRIRHHWFSEEFQAWVKDIIEKQESHVMYPKP